MLKKVQDAFKLAKLRQPSVLVLEEIDFMANPKSNKELFYTLLSELDSLNDSHQNLLILATTNKLDDLDKSLRRGGRLDIDIRFDMPNSEDRHSILKSHLSMIESAQILIKDEDI
jgi:ATP-dependent 26S proteasome regulatory subunit